MQGALCRGRDPVARDYPIPTRGATPKLPSDKIGMMCRPFPTLEIALGERGQYDCSLLLRPATRLFCEAPRRGMVQRPPPS